MRDRSHRIPSRANATCAGFSLVELMVTTAFVGIGLMALAQVFIMSAKHTSMGRKDSAATNLSAEILERMRCVSYDDMVSLFDNVDTSVPASVPPESRDWASHVAEQLGPGARGQVKIFTDDEGDDDGGDDDEGDDDDGDDDDGDDDDGDDDDGDDDGTLVPGIARVEVTIWWADRGDTVSVTTTVLISKVGV